VWLFGDSWTQGQGVSDQDTYAWKLNSLNPSLFVENFGTAGYSTFQAFLLLKRVLRERPTPPKLVILGFNPFMAARDLKFWSTDTQLKDEEAGVYVRPPFVVLRKNGDVAISPMWLTNPWSGETHLALISTLHNAATRLWQAFNTGEILSLNNLEKGRVTSIKIMKSIKEAVEDNGARFLVVYLCSGESPDWQPFRDQVKMEKIEAINCSIPDDNYNAYLNGGQPGMHPGPKGTDLFAQCIQSWLTREKLATETHAAASKDSG
jgi:hypothetical protein